MKRTRSLLTLLLTVLILMSAVAFGGLSASAQGEPSGLGWSGTTGYWDPPADENSYYKVTLYVSGTVVDEFTVTEPMAYFGTSMYNYGAGDYFFGVRGVYDGGPAWMSEEIISPVYHYDGGAGCSHPNLTHVGFKYPTCTEDGVKEHYECEDCGEWFWDANAQNSISDPDETALEKTGHNWGEWVIVDEPTTEKEGLAKRVCTEDSSHVETKTLPKLSDGESVEDVKKKLPELASAATEKSSEKNTEATSATAATSATEAAKGAQRTKESSDNDGLIAVLIIIGACLLIAVIAVILILVIKKNKKNGEN